MREHLQGKFSPKEVLFMVFWNWYCGVFAGDKRLALITSLAALGMLFAMMVTVCTKSKQLFFILFFGDLCGLGLALLANKKHLQASLVCLCSIGIIACIGYGIAVFALWCSQKKIRRQAEREKLARQIQYTLPDKENTYVRARLNTVLRVEEEGKMREEGKTPAIKMEYARKLLTALKNAPLTQTERLEIEDMSTLFSAFIGKEKWTAEDVRLISQLFSRLLKLSAKYAVVI